MGQDTTVRVAEETHEQLAAIKDTVNARTFNDAVATLCSAYEHVYAVADEDQSPVQPLPETTHSELFIICPFCSEPIVSIGYTQPSNSHLSPPLESFRTGCCQCGRVVDTHQAVTQRQGYKRSEAELQGTLCRYWTRELSDPTTDLDTLDRIRDQAQEVVEANGWLWAPPPEFLQRTHAPRQLLETVADGLVSEADLETKYFAPDSGSQSDCWILTFMGYSVSVDVLNRIATRFETWNDGALDLEILCPRTTDSSSDDITQIRFRDFTGG